MGMRTAYDEVMSNGIKRRHEPPRIVGDLLAAEIAEKQARSIKYQLTIANLPLAKDINDFNFYRHAGQRGADPRLGQWCLSFRTAQCRADRRNRACVMRPTSLRH